MVLSVVTEAATAAPLRFFLRAFCAAVAAVFFVGGARVAVFAFSFDFFCLVLLISGFGFSAAGRMVPYLKDFIFVHIC